MAEAVSWDTARRLAAKTARTEMFWSSYHADSLADDFRNSTGWAEQKVSEITGLAITGSPSIVVDRAQWAEANIESMRDLLAPVTEAMARRMQNKPLAPVARVAAGAELGVLLGWMSARVLGQYDPFSQRHDGDALYYVGPNVIGIEKRFGFPPVEFRRWIALHELTHRAQFTAVPWMKPHLHSLMTELMGSVESTAKRLPKAIGRAIAAKREGHSASDLGLLGLIATPEQRTRIDSAQALMSLLEGHAEVVMGRAGPAMPEADRFARVLQHRRNEAAGITRVFQRLLGIESKLRQYEAGRRFVVEVEKATDEEFFAKVWADPSHLPTMDEIAEPALWVERMRSSAA